MNIIKYLKLIMLSLVVVSLNGCSEDFLEKSPADDTVSVADIQETAVISPEISDATLRGLYTMMYTPGTGGLNGHNDFGQKGADIYSDILSADMALSKNTYGRFRLIAQLIPTVDYTDNTGNYLLWRYYYRVIRACNLIITAQGGNDAPITDANRFALGQAKTMRAYAYFHLTQYYIPEYTPTSEVLPIYIDSTDPDNKPSSPTKDVYDLMISDLTQSIQLLDAYNRSAKHEVNKDVAKSLLAYVYASMATSEGNVKAKTLAEEVIAAGYPLTSKAASVGGFNDISAPSWIWGVDLTLDSGVHLHSWWGQMDIFSYSYQYFGDTKSIDASLFNSIKPTDIRKTQFLDDPTSGWNGSPYKKFYDAARTPRGTGLYTQSDLIYLRVDEMYLLSAEMSAKEGQAGDAKTRLKELLQLRFDNPADYSYVDGLSGQSLIDEVNLQTRIELWGEGKSYFAMKRNKATVTRGANHLFLAGESIPYNDDRLTFEIPQSEIQNNPFISK